MIDFLKWYFELATSGFWTFIGVLFTTGALLNGTAQVLRALNPFNLKNNER
jgi:hypothetical protein